MYGTLNPRYRRQFHFLDCIFTYRQLDCKGIASAPAASETLRTRTGVGAQRSHGAAAQNILPWWRVFLQALVTTQFEFGQFVDDENLVAMKRKG